jgi:hypothetical protein
MGERPGQEWEERILGFEDLSEEEQRLTEAWLSEHPAAMDHLARLRGKEESSREPVPFMEGAMFEEPVLDSADSEAERASLADLRRQLGLADSGNTEGSAGSVVRFPVRTVKWAPWLGALAAALTLALLLPLMRDNDDLISGLSVHGFDSIGGAVRSSESHSLPSGVLATGQAFELNFHLDREARVVIIHLDPQGVIGRVVPDPTRTDFPALSGGEVHRFPGADSGENWILGPGAGTESFLIAAHRGDTPDLAGLDAGLAAGDLQELPRDAKIAAIREIFTERGAEVELVEFTHVD